MKLWRVGRKVPINVYEGDRPVCQCHTAADAKLIVKAVNAARSLDEGRWPPEFTPPPRPIPPRPTPRIPRPIPRVPLGLRGGAGDMRPGPRRRKR